MGRRFLRSQENFVSCGILEVKTMTNEQKIREKISTTEGLANYLTTYDDSYGEFIASDSERFETKNEAVNHEINWLKEEYNNLW